MKYLIHILPAWTFPSSICLSIFVTNKTSGQQLDTLYVTAFWLRQVVPYQAEAKGDIGGFFLEDTERSGSIQTITYWRGHCDLSIGNHNYNDSLSMARNIAVR